MSRPGVALLLQLAVSLTLLALLVRRLPLHEAAGALARLKPTTVAAGVALSMIGYWGRARRWSLLLERCGVHLGALASYRLTLVGTFYGLVTPGRIGELARVLHIPAPRSATLPAAVWDRVADVLLLEVLCAPAFALVPQWRGSLLVAYLGLVAVTLAGVACLASPRTMSAAARLVPALARPAAGWNETSGQLLRRGVGLASFGWGAFFYVFMVAAAWLLLRDLSPLASPLLLSGLPVIPLLGNLPVAFGGLGLREQVSAAVFSRFGAGAATGAVFSLSLFVVVTLIPGLLGFAASLVRGPRAASGSSRS
jgi:uncharacterized membrane protein YbhN (UPF0104 family)